jgi:RNA 2',3'-cyclic 3'-phosphodiesterase
MKSTVRTFVAVELDEAVRARASELIAALRASPAEVKWVDAHNLHLTLKFLDEVPLTDIPAVCAAVQAAAAKIEPFEMQIRGAGAFPNAGRPRTIWLGAREGVEAMAALHKHLEDSLAKVGFRKEHRRFQAHLTIGRVRGGGPAIKQLGDLLWQYADFNAGQLSVDELVVFSSQLERTGPIYEALGRAPLGRL